MAGLGSGHRTGARAIAIDKQALFESTKALWPRTMLLSDADAANDVYWANEKAIPPDESWRQIALWSYHQAVTELAERAAAQGLLTIRPREVRFEAFDRWMRLNLHGDDCWLTERTEWEATA